MEIETDANASYGFSFETFYDEHKAYLPKGYNHGLSDEEVADALGIPIDEVNVENTLKAVIKLKYDTLDIAYTGVVHGDVTVIYVKDSKIIADSVTVSLMFPQIFDDEKKQIHELASLFHETPGWIMYSTID